VRSQDTTAQAYRGYAKETMKRALAATRKRLAHLWAQKQFEEEDAYETRQPKTNEMPQPAERKVTG
jgi:hypothetical protein